MNTPRKDEQRCVIIPSFNSGPLLEKTVREVLACWKPIIVVMDGSTDGSHAPVQALAAREPSLHLIELPSNQGKGAAVLAGLDFAAGRGWTHAAVFDADGQHEASDLPRFMQVSQLHPEAMILGVPVFGPEAPTLRVQGRRAGNWFTNLETWWGGIHDSLFGFRVYPVESSRKILRSIRGARRFDFDTQLAVRLYWQGVPPINIPTPVHYREKSDGGVSHFHYLRDNLLLIAVHSGLIIRSLFLAPRLWQYRRRRPLALS